MNTRNIAVLVSGTGSLLEAMIADKLPISLVLADRQCRGIEIAKAAGIPARILMRTSYRADFDRRAFTLWNVDVLGSYDIGLVVMAGYMTVFSREMFEHFGGMILNTHPSLLPLFKGDHAVRDALAVGANVTGCTIHIATAELDAGPILAQQEVPVLEGDTEATLHERIKKVERELYPATIREFLTRDNTVVT